ncbi:hypothetical protein [Chitinophaga nivalis]|uniref:Low-complexity protein n=1 Tax=Chitinophaga nivalis TaxID=2991709 RepID=A0ABT3IR24_9BACT|nr:hypothetical protein [Chitinophaga nivalis]MCW3463890.1 hypothetical protein [Chitinophaga nivalis]MCW3486420.1 hypothetical protein [Chitinophaga nivalis]
MKNNSSISKKVLISGSLVASAILGLAAVHATANPVSYTDLGTGAAVRNALTGTPMPANTLELSCGAKKDSTAKTKEGKCGQGKCGEGKCGGHKKGKDKKGGKHKADSTGKSGQ